MPPNNDPVKPIPFDVVQPAPVPTATAHTADAPRQRETPVWVLPALGGLLLLAALVIFLLPAAIAPKDSAVQPTPESAGDAGSAAPTAATGKSSPATPETTPWSDAQLAKMRKEAQDMLQELLDLQFALQEHGVELWAPTAFAQVKTLAAEGDTLYQNRDFEQATARYKEGLSALQALQESMAGELQKLLAQARQAIAGGDQEAALAALAIATKIAPDNSDIATLQQRAKVLPQVLPLLAQAATAEAAGKLTLAQQLLQQALKLDPHHEAAQADLQRITSLARQQGFNEAMSQGYAALNEGHFDTARKAFRTAASLQQGSTEAASALQEVETAATAQRLAGLEQQGQQGERQEQWQKAVEAYEQAQKVDKSVLFASDGLKRSKARALLDQRLRSTIAAPQRLTDATVAASTEAMLAQAALVTPRGPLLEQQIKQLDKLLKQASVTVAVTLRSDKETEVTVYKVARLGRFDAKELTLRPGTYTATGTRNGYRDVRQTFTVAHDSIPAPITIICTDPI